MWTLGENRNIRSQVLDTLQFYTDIEIADYDYPTELRRKLLNWHEKHTFHGLVEYFNISLRQIGGNHQLKLKVNTTVQKTAFVLNINKTSPFIPQTSKMEIFQQRTSPLTWKYIKQIALFLTEAHFDLLHKPNTRQNGLVDDYLSLLRFSIPKGQSNVPTYLTHLSEKGVRKNYLGFLYHFTLPMNNYKVLSYHFVNMPVQIKELDVVYQEIVRHLNNSSPTYQITVEEFKIACLEWVDEVNLWENEINIEVGGLDLYAKHIVDGIV